MIRSRRLFLIAALCIMAASTLTCTVPKSIIPLFAPATPTPTLAPSATPTPLPPLNISPCPYSCPPAVEIYEYFSGNIEVGVINSVDIPYDQPISFYTFWIAKDYTILAQNLEHMLFFVKIDGHDYWDNSFMGTPEPYTFQDEPNTEYASQWAGVQVSGWKVGESHEIRIGITFTDQVDDGWDTYASGTVFEELYSINPVLSAPRISHPTITITPIPAIATQGNPQVVEEEGWIEIVYTGTVDLGQTNPTELGKALVFHGPNAVGEGWNCRGCYVLEPLPDASVIVPTEDKTSSGINFHPGEDYRYKIRATLSDKTMGDIFLGSLPVYMVSYLERLK